ncbi:MAG TPA: intermembrane transport protein PqiB [Gammaproteobacteria bacterium]|nr:intermembrane transport protein PqiB [Gammaproteobacteria bacterium]
MKIEEEMAKSKMVKIKSISIIWLVPFVALLIGAWMLYFQLSHQGDLVTISFKDGAGIEAGKTKIKVKNVQIGIVEKIELNKTLDGVVVSARVHNNEKNLLMDDSAFWVVRPKIGKGGVTGLSTLVSGAYIELSPGISDNKEKHFTGLESAPVTASGSPGLHITLANRGGYHLQVGDDILFRGIKVGRIEYVYFNADERMVYYNAFVESPYDELVTTNTKFWEINGVEIHVSADGIDMQTGTLETLISGGVTFDVPAGLPLGGIVKQREVFAVFSDKAAIDDDLYEKGIQYILLFKGSVRGLSVGAPVTFRGVKVGRVVRTDIDYPKMGHLLNPDTYIPIMITIDPAHVGYKENEILLGQAKKDIMSLLQQGLHGRIETGNLLTGSKYITLQYETGLTTKIKHFNGYDVIPTLGDQFDQIINRFSGLLDKLNQLPLKKIFNTTSITLKQTEDTLKNIGQASSQLETLLKQSSDENLVGNINAVLMNIKKLSASFSTGSPTNQTLNNTLRAMQDSLNELKPLLIQLNQNPDSLIFGNKQKNDIEPEGIHQ